MKLIKTAQVSVFLILILPILGNAQSISYIPGPANQDTSKFARVYFLRDTIDDFPDNWFGVVLNNESGYCVKTKMNSIYRVNTFLTGDTRFWTSISGVKEEITLNLQPGKNYYVELKPKKHSDKNIIVTMKVLDDSIGSDRIQAFPGRIQDRYSLLPVSGNNDFRQNAYEDTIRWYADKKYEYHFLPLPSWEVILRSTLNTVFGFRNKLVSNTYSETGGILYLQYKRGKSELDFENYCRHEFAKSINDNEKDSVISLNVKPFEAPEKIKYARLVSLENWTMSETISNDKPLLTRSTFVVFYWLDDKGKGNTASLYTSERGLPEELQPMIELEERIKWSWQSFRLNKKAPN